jgi:CheY-like chemotaxis protein
MRRRALEAGANAYFTKPIRFPDLIAELNRLLAARQAE